MKRSLRSFILSCIFLPVALSAFAQSSEIGGLIGVSYYNGELNPRTQFAGSQFGGGVFYRYNFNPRWAFKVSAMFGRLKASDEKTNDNNPRNLTFESPITEFSVQGELNFVELYSIKSRDNLTAYIFGGIGMFSFNPRAQYEGAWYDLQLIGTEGQGFYGKDRYNLQSVCLPFGIGIKYTFATHFTVGFEWGFRKTFTDYIDDVSTTYIYGDDFPEITAALADPSEMEHTAGSARGDSSNNDWYSFAGITLSVKLFERKDNTCIAYPNKHALFHFNL